MIVLSIDKLTDELDGTIADGKESATQMVTACRFKEVIIEATWIAPTRIGCRVKQRGNAAYSPAIVTGAIIGAAARCPSQRPESLQFAQQNNVGETIKSRRRIPLAVGPKDAVEQSGVVLDAGRQRGGRCRRLRACRHVTKSMLVGRVIHKAVESPVAATVVGASATP